MKLNILLIILTMMSAPVFAELQNDPAEIGTVSCDIYEKPRENSGGFLFEAG